LILRCGFSQALLGQRTRPHRRLQDYFKMRFEALSRFICLR